MYESATHDVNKAYQEFERTLEDKIAAAAAEAVHGHWSKKDKSLDQPKISQVLNRSIKTRPDGKIAIAKWVVATRQPHLYKAVIEMANEHVQWEYNLIPNVDLTPEYHAHIAEELLHGVPTLGGEPNIKDRVYGVAFLYDETTRLPLVQPFFAYHDITQNKELKIDVLENPSRILGTDIGNIDKLQR